MIKVIVIDDELHAREYLERLIQNIFSINYLYLQYVKISKKD
jgi:sulfur transfer complex TusBCD TusB component (DsrH family)